MLSTLQRRELLNVARQLSDELGKCFIETHAGQPVEGVLPRRLDLASGRFALVDKSREFTLVPWREVLQHHLGKAIGGTLRRGGVSWDVGRGKGAPTVD